MAMWRWLPAAALLCLLPVAAWAQVVIPDPQGVYLDNDGVLRTRETDKGKRLDKLRKQAKGKDKDRQLCYVSLPRVLAEARKCIEAGQPVLDRIRYLGGMVKVQYVFVYPDEGDIVLAGHAEPFDDEVPFRPVGTKTGRPVLQLDDFVTALRTCGPGKEPPRVGCDIEVTQEIADRVRAKIREVAPKASSMGVRNAADEVAKAGGKQPVVYYGVAENTRFAFVCVEADYLLKHLALGLFESPVRKVRSYNDLIPRPERAHRFSLESQYDALLASADGNAFEIRGPSLKVCSGLLQRLGRQEGEISNAARKFIDGCNKHFDALCRNILSWSDLCNLSDLSVIAALIAKDGLHTKVNWDLAWALDPKGYPVAEVKTAKFAHRLANYHYTGNMLLFTSGGVRIGPEKWVKERTIDTENALKRPARPDGEVWIPTEKGK